MRTLEAQRRYYLAEDTRDQSRERGYSGRPRRCNYTKHIKIVYWCPAIRRECSNYRKLARFLPARLDEEAGSAQRCGADGCGEWTAHGHTVDFCQVDLSGFHPTIALHVALRNPARVLRECEAKRHILPSLPAVSGRATTCVTLPRVTPTTLNSPARA
ncbi:DUF6221 family protein [Streptomyces griseus]|uniref:DUF6221 family protein n=1 Tax=Streptomyces griseus TaxID=1911 RepID=UPI0036A14DE7